MNEDVDTLDEVIDGLQDENADIRVTAIRLARQLIHEGAIEFDDIMVRRHALAQLLPCIVKLRLLIRDLRESWMKTRCVQVWTELATITMARIAGISKHLVLPPMDIGTPTCRLTSSRSEMAGSATRRLATSSGVRVQRSRRVYWQPSSRAIKHRRMSSRDTYVPLISCPSPMGGVRH